MNNSKKRGWLWCAILCVIAIIIIIVLPRKEENNSISDLEILPDSIIEHTEYSNQHYKKQFSKPTKKASQPQIDYNHLYEKPTPKPSKYESFKVKVNEADTNDLKELKGIGSAYARRIINYRNSLGGYYNKEQLKEVYGMNNALYDLIESHIIIDTNNVKLINLNTATLDQLKRHPYLDYYQAKAIVTYRNKVGLFNSLTELMDIALIDTTTFNKIKRYITI